MTPPKDALLDIRFFKVGTGPLALIIDWILDRTSGTRRYRASLHEGSARRVLVVTEPIDAKEENVFEPDRTRGSVGDVSWDLAIDAGDDRVAPHLFPVTELGMLDMTLTSSPRAAFTGRITVGGRAYECRSAPGSLSHYWGRCLPREWWWVSCSRFDVPGVAVETTVLRSGLWGLDIGIPMGYLYLRLPDGKTQTLIAPPAIHWAGGNRSEFEVRFRRPFSAPIRLLCRGRDWNDWDDRIWNTLVGDLEVRVGDALIATADGTAGLERRFPPHPQEKKRKETTP